jgi:hypothetical protein
MNYKAAAGERAENSQTGRPTCARKESQGVLVIRATASKSLTSVLNGGLRCACCLAALPVTQPSYLI